jgi:hypothetical protein
VRIAPRLGYAKTVFLVAAPLLWAVLLLLHPRGDTTAFYPVVTDAVAQWQLVHIGSVVFIPLMGAAIYVLVSGVDNAAAKVARVAVAPFIVFYGAFEILVGVGTGILVNEVNALPAGQRGTGERLVEGFAESSVPFVFTVLGGVALATALLAAGLAFLRSRDGARHLAPVVLLAIAAPLIGIHEPPAGPVGLVLFVVAVLIVSRQEASVQGRSPVAYPATGATPA